MLSAPDAEIQEFLFEIAPDRVKMEELIATKIQEVGEAQFYNTARRIILYVTDILWIEHLETMDHVRSSVNLRAYGQREPIIEYKKEGLNFFNQMEASLKEQVLSLIDTIRVAAASAEAPKEAPKQYMESGGGTESENAGQTIQKSEEDKIGRNDIVIIQKGNETQEIKYKKAEQLLSEGWTIKEVKK